METDLRVLGNKRRGQIEAIKRLVCATADYADILFRDVHVYFLLQNFIISTNQERN